MPKNQTLDEFYSTFREEVLCASDTETSGWTTEDFLTYGKTNSKVRGPFEQAKDGIFSIVDAMKKRVDIEHRYIPNVLFGYGVMFPDIEYTSSGIDEEQWQVFDSRDGSNVKQFIKRMAEGVKSKWESLYGPLNKSKLPDAADVRYMASILRGDFDCAVSMNVQLHNASEALIALTKEQY